MEWLPTFGPLLLPIFHTWSMWDSNPGIVHSNGMSCLQYLYIYT